MHGKRAPEPHSTRTLAAVLFWGLASTCVSVDARGDLDETARLVGERTGTPTERDREASEERIRAALDEMLVDGLTVAEAVRVALLWNPALRSAYQDVGIRKAELVAAGLPRNPFVSVSARLPEGGGLLNLTTSLSQSLVDLFLLPARKRAGEARLSVARWQVVRAAVRLAGRVEAEAFDLIALQRGRAITDETLALAQRSLDVAEARLRGGLGDAVDVNLARAAVLAVRKDGMDLDRDLAVRSAVLQELLGLPPGSGAWSIRDELPPPLETGDTDVLVARALERRLDVEVARLAVAAARGDLDVEEGSRVPDLALGFEYERAESPPSLGGPVLEGSLPLFSRNEAGVARAEFLVAKARDELVRVQNEVAREVREAAARLRSARAVVTLFDAEILPGASASIEASQRAWQAGERDVLVVLEAQRLLLEQRRAYVAALREAARAQAELEVALGGTGAVEPVRDEFPGRRGSE